VKAKLVGLKQIVDRLKKIKGMKNLPKSLNGIPRRGDEKP